MTNPSNVLHVTKLSFITMSLRSISLPIMKNQNSNVPNVPDFTRITHEKKCDGKAKQSKVKNKKSEKLSTLVASDDKKQGRKKKTPEKWLYNWVPEVDCDKNPPDGVAMVIFRRSFKNVGF